MGNSVSKHSLETVNSPTAASHNLLLCQFDEVRKLRQRFHVSKLAFGAGIVALQLTICEPCFGTRAMFQEDEQMADQNEAKTKTIGFLEPISKSFEEDDEAGKLDKAEEVVGVVLPANEDPALPHNGSESVCAQDVHRQYSPPENDPGCVPTARP